MHFVFVTYPYHYHITLVSIKSVVDLYGSEVLSITVMFDDFHHALNARIDFIQYMHEYLASMNISAQVLPFSLIDDCARFDDGWERQQIVKLNLHKLLVHDRFFCVEGDTILLEKLDLNKLYINVQDGSASWPQAYNFANYVLDLDYQKVIHNGHTMNTLTGTTIRNISSSMLEQLHAHIFKLHGCSIVDIIKSFTLKKNRAQYFVLGEWDLMSYFEIFIAKTNLPIEDLPAKFVSTDEFETYQCKDKIIMLGGKDNLSPKWYQSRGITYNHEVAAALKYKKHLL